MPENERIRAIIEKYQGYLKCSDADVAQTQKGVWFFLVHDPEAESYYRFFRFTTAEELERGIVEMFADELNYLMEVSVEAGYYATRGDASGSGLGGVSCDGCMDALAQLEENVAVLNLICQKNIPKLKSLLENLPVALAH